MYPELLFYTVAFIFLQSMRRKKVHLPAACSFHVSWVRFAPFLSSGPYHRENMAICWLVFSAISCLDISPRCRLDNLKDQALAGNFFVLPTWRSRIQGKGRRWLILPMGNKRRLLRWRWSCWSKSTSLVEPYFIAMAVKCLFNTF